MTRYLFGRILSLIFVLFVVSIITFTLMHSVPGGPFDETKSPLPPAAKENILAKYGLDKPMHIQYLNYMKNVILHFDYDGILGTTLLIGVAFVIINITVDVIQAYIDPKIIDTL